MRGRSFPGLTSWVGLALLVGLAAVVLVFGAGTALASSVTYTCKNNVGLDQPAVNFDINNYDVVKLNGPARCVGNFTANSRNVIIQGQSSATLYGNDTTDPVLTIVGYTVTIKNLTITNGNNDGSNNGDGGGGIWAHNATVYLITSSVTGNHATNAVLGGEGGGIYLHHATLFVYQGSSISYNTADGPGGGIAAAFGSPVTVKDSHVSGNNANTTGGGIMLDWSSKYSPGTDPGTLTNATVNDNTVHDESGAYGGGISVNHNTLTVNNSTIKDNTADTGADTGYGGGIYGKSANVLLDIVTIEDNTATFGGGIYTEGVPYTVVDTQPSFGSQTGLWMTESNCVDNTAVNDGGCLDNDSFVACTIQNGAPKIPCCPSAPKAVCELSPGSDGIFTTPATIVDSEILYNTAGEGNDGNGGGIANVSESGNTATLTIYSSDIAFNSASEDGGGIYNSVEDSGGTATATLKDTNVLVNRADLNGGGIASENGAGTAHLYLYEHTFVSSNRALVDGGGVFLSGALTNSGALVTGNQPDDIS
jgi:predicted outer membrane repeat protein